MEEQLTPADRDLLLQIAHSPQTSQGMAERSLLVLACADFGIAQAARRRSVSTSTAAKWWRRFGESGIDGLNDVPRSGRPAASDQIVRTILECTLHEPPDGATRWTTRTMAKAAGVSQATVSRVRARLLPSSYNLLPNLSTAILVYVDVQPAGCALGLQHSYVAAMRRDRQDHRDVVETVLASRLLDDFVGPGPRRSREAGSTSPSALDVLRRAAERLPLTSPATLVIDVELDDRARQWLSHHPEFTVHTVSGESWLSLLPFVADAVDPRQLPELRDLQRLIRQARRDGSTSFSWTHSGGIAPADSARPAAPPERMPPTHELATVVRGVCMAVAAGKVQPGEEISPRQVAQLTGAREASCYPFPP